MLYKNLHFKLSKLYKPLLLLIGIIVVQPVHAAIRDFKKQPDGVVFNLDKGLMKIKICSADIVEVKYTVFNTFQTKESLVVNN